jgi:hypothetical protein
MICNILLVQWLIIDMHVTDSLHIVSLVLFFKGTPALRSSIYYAISMVLTFAPPYLLKALVGHLEGSVAYSQQTLWLLVAGVLIVRVDRLSSHFFFFYFQFFNFF